MLSQINSTLCKLSERSSIALSAMAVVECDIFIHLFCSVCPSGFVKRGGSECS